MADAHIGRVCAFRMLHYIMANSYSNEFSFYCFATKLIGVTEKVNYMMSNYNI